MGHLALIKDKSMKIKAVVFDAYGTLFDVYSIQVLAETFYPNQGADIAIKWHATVDNICNGGETTSRL